MEQWKQWNNVYNVYNACNAHGLLEMSSGTIVKKGRNKIVGDTDMIVESSKK
jgi:hypothetical protein